MDRIDQSIITVFEQARRSDPPPPWTPLWDCVGVPCEKIRNGNLLHIHSGIDQNVFAYGSQSFFGPTSSPVSCWAKSHGAPFMSRLPNQAGYSSLRKDIVMDAQVGGQTNGVLQFQNFEKGKLYFLSFKYQVVKTVFNTTSIQPHPPYTEFGSLDHFHVKFVNAANGSNGFQLVVAPPANYLSFVKQTPTPTSFQNIGELTDVPETTVTLPNPTGALPAMHEVTFCVRADADYNAIWFYPQQNAGTDHNSRIRIKNIQMYEASAGANALAGCGGGSSVQLGQGCATIPGATYSWSPTNGLNNPNVLNPSLNTSGLANVQNGVQYTLTVNWNDCSISDSVTVTSNRPVLNMPEQIPMCEDDFPIWLSANPTVPNSIIYDAYQWYRWNENNNTFEALAGANYQLYWAWTPGVYVVVADAGNGCIGFAFVSVFIQELPANLNTDFLLWAVGPSGQATFQMYVNPAINPSAQGLFHAYYISEVDANFQNPQFVGVVWGNNGGQVLSYIDVNTQVQTNLFNRETYYEIKHGIWNKCRDWTETRRYIYVD